MSSSDEKLTGTNFRKLSRSNWAEFKIVFTGYLQSEGLWGYVDGTAVRPLDLPSDASYDQRVRHQKEEKDYLDGKTKALGKMKMACSASELIHLKDCKTPKEAWDKWVATYVD